MPDRLFVRGLWGDDAMPRRPKVLADVRRTVELFPHRPEPQTVYCYGRENLAFCEGLGLRAELAHPQPLVDWLGEYDGSPRERGPDPHEPFGMSVWRHKLDAMLRGLADADEVVWLDWDCQLARELPEDFWERLAAGPPLQACLTRYKYPKCLWRSVPNEQQTDLRHYVPCGSFVYCRDAWIVRFLLELQRCEPHLYDEQLYAVWTDVRLRDGGQEFHPTAYRAAGYEPPGVWVHRAVWPPEDFWFYAPLRHRPGRRVRRHS